MISSINKVILLGKKRFVQDTAVLQVGSFFSTGLSFLASIIYARVLGVDGYASYALIFIFVSLTGVFMNVGTNPSALTLLSGAYAKEEKDQIKNILTYYIKVTLLISLIVGIIIIIIAPFLTTRLYDSHEIGQLARVIIVSNIIKVFFGMYIIVLQVIRKIKNLTFIENLNKAFYVIIPAGLVLFGFGLTGLVIGHLIVAVGFALFAIVGYRKLRLKTSLLPSWREIVYNFRAVKISYYFKFGFLIAVDKNLGSLYSTIPLFILGIFNFEYVAFLKIAIAYAGLPLILIGPISRLLTVQLPKSKSYSLKIFKSDFVRSSVGSFLIALVTSAFFAILAFILIPFVYGQEYLPAIALSYPLLVGSVIVALGVGLSSIFRTLNLMKNSILINLILITIGTCVIYFSIKYFSMNIAIYPIAFWLPVVTLIFYTYILRYVNREIKKENQNV